MEAAETLEGMFPGMENRDDHKQPSNPLQKFTVVTKFGRHNTRAEEGAWRLQRTDDLDKPSVRYALTSLDGGVTYTFPASDIRKVDVPNREVVIEPDKDGSHPQIVNE